MTLQVTLGTLRLSINQYIASKTKESHPGEKHNKNATSCILRSGRYLDTCKRIKEFGDVGKRGFYLFIKKRNKKEIF